MIGTAVVVLIRMAAGRVRASIHGGGRRIRQGREGRNQQWKEKKKEKEEGSALTPWRRKDRQ